MTHYDLEAMGFDPALTRQWLETGKYACTDEKQPFWWCTTPQGVHFWNAVHDDEAEGRPMREEARAALREMLAQWDDGLAAWGERVFASYQSGLAQGDAAPVYGPLTIGPHVPTPPEAGSVFVAFSDRDLLAGAVPLGAGSSQLGSSGTWPDGGYVTGDLLCIWFGQSNFQGFSDGPGDDGAHPTRETYEAVMAAAYRRPDIATEARHQATIAREKVADILAAAFAEVLEERIGKLLEDPEVRKAIEGSIVNRETASGPVQSIIPDPDGAIDRTFALSFERGVKWGGR